MSVPAPMTRSGGPVGGDTPCGAAWPDRFTWELARLRERGRVTGAGRETAPPGFLVVRYEWDHRGRTLPLAIIYPPGFPLTRPEIRMLRVEDRPRNHCNPVNGNLCFLAHDRHAWQPETSVASYIEDRLPMILDGTPDGEPVAEPMEDWWAALAVPGSAFVIESGWELGTHTCGTLALRVGVVPGRPPALRAFVEGVLDGGGGEIARNAGPLPLEFSAARSIRVPWRLLDEEPQPDEYERVFGAVSPGTGTTGLIPLADSLRARIAAVACRTEITHGERGLSWILLVRTGSRRAFEHGRADQIHSGTARTLRAGLDDRRSRSPSAGVIAGKRIAIVGLGAVGAPVALDLARNGARSIAMADLDIVTPGNAVRWPLGESAWGRFKVDALADFIAANHAATRTAVARMPIGNLDFRTAEGEGGEFVAALNQADLVVDCSTSFEVERLLARHAGSMGAPLISAYGTAAFTGGVVACFAPGGGCPNCLLHQYGSGAIARPSGERGDAHAVRLPGCADATFSGASHDLGELSMHAVRVAVRTLRAAPATSFVETLNFVGEDRRPAWRFDPFERHPACACG